MPSNRFLLEGLRAILDREYPLGVCSACGEIRRVDPAGVEFDDHECKNRLNQLPGSEGENPYRRAQSYSVG